MARFIFISLTTLALAGRGSLAAWWDGLHFFSPQAFVSLGLRVHLVAIAFAGLLFQVV
jgi:hypothetical protein